MTLATIRPLPLAALVVASLGLPALPADAVGNPIGLPSYECRFTEPFIDVVMSEEELVVIEAGKKAKAWQFQSADVIEGEYHFIRNGKRTTLTIKEKPGSDGMSDRTFPLTGLFRSSTGGCVRHPDRWVPRRVKGVATNDVLNVRKAAKATAPKVAAVKNGQRIFVAPSTTKWKQLSVVAYPGGESGPVAVAKGWAKGDFITTKPDATY